ncbi:MAG: hypothetical protein KGY81_00115 [Phycisphaerae bacterium]|nr:hypothetical protein [Phycisphaerae bacterium]
MSYHYTDACEMGFAPDASGEANAMALQEAVDRGGTVIVSRPGTYDIARTVYLGSDTALTFGRGVKLRKTAELGPFTYVLRNKGAVSRTWDERITVSGLHLEVNGVDARENDICGLIGHVSFFYVRDLRIEGFRCLDLMPHQFALQICTFEDLLVDDVIIHGQKDGVHLGRGKRFAIRNGVFRTVDDAIALNAHDYTTSNPEVGWLEDGVVENCRDLDQPKRLGFFCRLLAGAWTDWRDGMAVQRSDSVVSGGRLYRVGGVPDGTVYRSTTRPTHETGVCELDGIEWVMAQDDPLTSAGVRDVVFRDIMLEKPRTGFSVHFDCDRYSRSYYPGADRPVQEQILLDNVHVQHDEAVPLVWVGTPVDAICIRNSRLADSGVHFHNPSDLEDFGRTAVSFVGCVFRKAGAMPLLVNDVEGRQIDLATASSVVLHEDFRAEVAAGGGAVAVNSDLPGLVRSP